MRHPATHRLSTEPSGLQEMPVQAQGSVPGRQSCRISLPLSSEALKASSSWASAWEPSAAATAGAAAGEAAWASVRAAAGLWTSMHVARTASSSGAGPKRRKGVAICTEQLRALSPAFSGERLNFGAAGCSRVSFGVGAGRRPEQPLSGCGALPVGRCATAQHNKHAARQVHSGQARLVWKGHASSPHRSAERTPSRLLDSLTRLLQQPGAHTATRMPFGSHARAQRLQQSAEALFRRVD